jgi:amino acid permease
MEKTVNWFEKVKQNHLLLMIICCALPLVVLLVFVYGFGIRNNYIWWAAILLCPISHLIMMRFMHDDDKGSKGGCH